MLCNLSTHWLGPPGCMTAVERLSSPVYFWWVMGEDSENVLHLEGTCAVCSFFFTCALGGSASSLWTLRLDGPDSRSDTLHWTVGTWRKEEVSFSTKITGWRRRCFCYQRQRCSDFPLRSFFTYLSIRFLCLRMWLTSAAVAGPCSFWPFSISFSSSSMDWGWEETWYIQAWACLLETETLILMNTPG